MSSYFMMILVYFKTLDSGETAKYIQITFCRTFFLDYPNATVAAYADPQSVQI